MGEALGPVAEVRPILADLDDGFRAAVQEWLSQGIAARGIHAARIGSTCTAKAGVSTTAVL